MILPTEPVPLSPGNCGSAGKRYSGKTRKVSRWLKSGLVEAALAAGRTWNTALGHQYHQLKLRRGSKRATVAVAHSLLVIAYHIVPLRTKPPIANASATRSIRKTERGSLSS